MVGSGSPAARCVRLEYGARASRPRAGPVRRLEQGLRLVVGGRFGSGFRARSAIDRYFVRLNWKGICVNCFTFRPPTSAGWNRMDGSALITVAVNRSCVDLRTLKVLMSATPLVSTTN